jgi:hypothetical protein
MEIRSLKAIAQALNEQGVQYLIVGGLAVNAHGYERFTHDVDLVIGLHPENLRRGIESLLAIGYQPAIPVTVEEFIQPERRAEWRRDKAMLVLKLWSEIHRRTPIDVFVDEPFDFAAEYQNAEPIDIGDGVVAFFLGRDALLKMKRKAGRIQDQADVTALEEIRRLGENNPENNLP